MIFCDSFPRLTILKKYLKELSLGLFVVLLASCSEPATESKNNTSEPKKEDRVIRSNKSFLTDCKAMLIEAKKMDSILLQETEINEQSANQAIKAFNEYASYCHNDSLSPVFLIKSAQVSRAINKTYQARVTLHECVDKYPFFKNRPAALFLLAQTYDDSFSPSDEEKAKMLYEEIIEKYPTSDWASSAKGAIKFLGKTDEQIMNEFNRDSKTTQNGKRGK